MTEGAIRHAVDGDGREVLNRKLPREKVLGFLAAIPSCDVALEASSSSHYWAAKSIGAAKSAAWAIG